MHLTSSSFPVGDQRVRCNDTAGGEMMQVFATRALIIRRVPLFAHAMAEQLMSMPALRTDPWTLEEVERLVEEREGYTPRYELVDGELLVSPSPSVRHQRIVARLFLRLVAYVDRFRLGEVLPGPVATRLGPESYFEPDLVVIPAMNGKRAPSATSVTQLLLVVEVLSPGSIRHDRITKRKYFQRHGVPEYWIVDGGAEAFEVWRPDEPRPAIQDEQLTWHPADATEPFGLDVREFFAEVADEP
jgi:Uma2 family endonuclease